MVYKDVVCTDVANDSGDDSDTAVDWGCGEYEAEYEDLHAHVEKLEYTFKTAIAQTQELAIRECDARNELQMIGDMISTTRALRGGLTSEMTCIRDNIAATWSDILSATD